MNPNETPPQDAAAQPPPTAMDNIMDRVDNALDPEEADKKVMGRLQNPFVKWTVVSLIALLFLIFITYFLSFILKIPLPESAVLTTLMNVIVEIMKILVPA
jgi:hypothetical protein